MFNTIQNSKCTDIDNIQIKPVKYVLDILTPIITHIFNISISSGIFPKKMQIAKVIVIFKGGDKNDHSNYRPISILPVFSKCLEKIIHRRMTSFCDRFSLITSSQYGFRKDRSTELTLLNQTEFILKSFKQNL